MAVGAPGPPGAVPVPCDFTGESAGRVLVYETDGLEAGLRETIPSPSPEQSGFGYQVALSGNGRLLATWHLVDEVLVVHVFERGDEGWELRQTLPAADGVIFVGPPRFEFSHDGTVAAMRAETEEGSSAVRVLRRVGGRWEVESTLVAGDANFGFGLALSADGELLAVGSPTEEGPETGATDAGAIHLFNHDALGWQLVAHMELQQSVELGRAGRVIAMNDARDTLAAVDDLGALIVARGAPGRWDELRLEGDSSVGGFTWVGLDQTGTTMVGREVQSGSPVASVFQVDPVSGEVALVQSLSPPERDDWVENPRAMAISADGSTIALGLASRQLGSRCGCDAPAIGAVAVFRQP